MGLLWLAWPKRGLEFGFIDGKAVGWLVCRHAHTLSRELKLALTDQKLASKLGKALTVSDLGTV